MRVANHTLHIMLAMHHYHWFLCFQVYIYIYAYTCSEHLPFALLLPFVDCVSVGGKANRITNPTMSLGKFKAQLDGHEVHVVYHGGCPDGCLAALIICTEIEKNTSH